MKTETVLVLAENVKVHDMIYPWDDLINPIGSRLFEVHRIVKNGSVICMYITHGVLYVKYGSKCGDKEKILVRTK